MHPLILQDLIPSSRTLKALHLLYLELRLEDSELVRIVSDHRGLIMAVQRSKDHSLM